VTSPASVIKPSPEQDRRRICATEERRSDGQPTLAGPEDIGQRFVWYRTAIPRAEQLYEDYLAERKKETGP
jgi:hypothetical protein